MLKLPMDVQPTKESSDGCQRSSSSQVDVFKAFLHAMAGESHDRAARVGIFGGAVQVVDGVLSVGQMGGVWRRIGLAMAFLGSPSDGSPPASFGWLTPSDGSLPPYVIMV